MCNMSYFSLIYSHLIYCNCTYLFVSFCFIVTFSKFIRVGSVLIVNIKRIQNPKLSAAALDTMHQDDVGCFPHIGTYEAKFLRFQPTLPCKAAYIRKS